MPFTVKKIDSYHVVDETGKVHAKCTSERSANKQIKMLEKKHGGNVLVDVAEKVGLKKRDPSKFPPKVMKMLEKFGNETVTSIVVARVPLSSFVTNLLNVISLGTYEKSIRESPYEKMFHLFMIINGKFTLEKNSVLNFVESTKALSQKDVEKMDVPMTGESFTIQQMFDKTVEKIGMKDFTNYRATSTNCQHLIMSILDANGLLTEDLKEFIYQNPREIFDRMPTFAQKIGQTLTDAEAIVDKIIEGEGSTTPKRKISKYNLFVKEYMAKNKGKGPAKDLMKQAGAAYKKSKT
jgi:hypothetical protein